MTQASQDFDISFADATRLSDLYDAEIERSKPRIPEKAEVLKRAALIMAVTAFESYIEDYLWEMFRPRIEGAESPEKFKPVLEIVAKKWMREHPNNPGAFVEWTGNGWKNLLKADLEQRLKALNAPKSDIVIRLFRQFLGVDLSSFWSWQGYAFDPACKRLDDIVALRGRIAHVARKGTSQPKKHDVSRPELKKYLTFIEGLVAATEKVRTT